MAEPVVSILMPVRNEEKFLARTLETVFSQDFPEPLEILVMDGDSADGTRTILAELARAHPELRILANPRRLQSFGMNIGIREARGEFVVRMDAHTLYAPDYVRCCVELLRRGDAAEVGGVQKAAGVNYVTCAIAAAMCHPFGVGNARFRYTDREIYADTVYLGAWRRRTLLDMGGFLTEFNEEGDLNCRLRRAGLKILVSPRIRLEYLVRQSFWGLARQYAWYGRARMQTLVRYPDALQVRQLAPLALLVGLLVSAAIFPMNHMLGLAVPAAYLGADVLASAHLALRKGPKYLPALLAAFPTMHLAWAVGACAGMARFGVPWASLRSLGRSAGAFRRFVRAKADSA